MNVLATGAGTIGSVFGGFLARAGYEEGYLCDYETFGDVVAKLPHFIEEAHNRKMIHRELRWIPVSLLVGGKRLAVRRGKSVCLSRAFSCTTVGWA